MILKSDALGEKINEHAPEPTSLKEGLLSLIKANSNSIPVETEQKNPKQNSSQFIPILDFIKKKKAQAKFASHSKSKRAIAFQKYQECINLKSHLNAILIPKIINKFE